MAQEQDPYAWIQEYLKNLPQQDSVSFLAKLQNLGYLQQNSSYQQSQQSWNQDQTNSQAKARGQQFDPGSWLQSILGGFSGPQLGPTGLNTTIPYDLGSRQTGYGNPSIDGMPRARITSPTNISSGPKIHEDGGVRAESVKRANSDSESGGYKMYGNEDYSVAEDLLNTYPNKKIGFLPELNKLLEQTRPPKLQDLRPFPANEDSLDPGYQLTKGNNESYRNFLDWYNRDNNPLNTQPHETIDFNNLWSFLNPYSRSKN